MFFLKKSLKNKEVLYFHQKLKGLGKEGNKNSRNSRVKEEVMDERGIFNFRRVSWL